MANIRDIAREAGVGISTVSRALNGTGYVEAEKKKRIREIASSMGYVFHVEEEAPKASKRIGVLLPDVSFPFYASFLKYVELELSNHGYRTIVGSAGDNSRMVSEMAGMLEEGSLDGLIINADVSEADILRMQGKAVVSFERLLGRGIPVVSSDHEQGCRLAARLLWENGCKKVLIFGASNKSRAHVELLFHQGKEIFARAGLQANVVEVDNSLLSYRFVEEIVSQYMDIYSDIDGIVTGALSEYVYLAQAKKRGIRVPEDLKIIGYDGNEISRVMTTAVTSIAQNVPALARTCVDVLMRRLASLPVKQQYLVPVRLQKGDTA